MRVATTRIALLAVSVVSACQSETPPGQSYFDRVVQPILNQSCSMGSSGCHRADPSDQNAFASGNLDLSSYENLLKRKDVLRTHGAYPVPFLLAKAVGETTELKIVYREDQQLPLQIPHAGGKVFSVGSPAFLTLQLWLSNGAREDGVKQVPVPVMGVGDCSQGVPADFNEAELTATTQWQQHAGDFDAVQQILSQSTCNAGNCHGAQQSDFYLTCGSTPSQKAFNFRQVWAFVGTPVDRSEVLWRPVAGGAQHTGGAHYTGPQDAKYLTVKVFAEAVGPYTPARSEPQRFFQDRVMPVLLSRGCAAEGCHSPAAMNDFKMRAGSPGFFSALSLDKNYKLARDEFMAFEVPDVRRSRIVAKNIFPSNGGIAHRGGALLELGAGGAANPAACGAYDPATSSAFCTFVEWSRLERAAAGDPNGGNRLSVVYVERDAGDAASLLDFTTFQGGADLRAADGPVDANGTLGALTGARSLLGGCSLAGADIRGPDVKNDGVTVVFSARRAAGDTWQLWTVRLDGSQCRALLAEAGVNHFDPAWSPDGEWVVYASSKAGGTSKRLGLAQSDIWRVRADGSGAERMTFLSNSEIGPQFMREGRVSMTTEKVDVRDPTGGFYQLAGRRINWDLTDYHPLLGQRADSLVDPANPSGGTAPSIGFAQATEIREGLDGNFLLVVSPAGAPATAGSLAVFNRSVGPFERGRSDPGFLPGVVYHDPAAGGAYRSPYPLLDGKVMASYAGSAALDFDLVAVNSQSHERTTLLAAARSQLEAVVALEYEPRALYLNRRQLVFGGAQVPTDLAHATVHFPDAPMLATLLGANLRRGRNAAAFRMANRLLLVDASGGAMGSAALADDGSARIRAPSGTPLYIGLARDNTTLFMMSEEHQFGPGENISIGVKEGLFDQVCAGCHGSVSGREIDIGVTADALTGASESKSRNASPSPVGN